MNARNEDHDFHADVTEGVLRGELDWLIICHNCAAYNCAEEEYPSRPLYLFLPITSNICRVD